MLFKKTVFLWEVDYFSLQIQCYTNCSLDSNKRHAPSQGTAQRDWKRNRNAHHPCQWMEDTQKTPETDEMRREKAQVCWIRTYFYVAWEGLCTLLAGCGLFPPASALKDFTMTQNKTLRERTPLSPKPQSNYKLHSGPAFALLQNWEAEESTQH